MRSLSHNIGVAVDEVAKGCDRALVGHWEGGVVDQDGGSEVNTCSGRSVW